MLFQDGDHILLFFFFKMAPIEKQPSLSGVLPIKFQIDWQKHLQVKDWKQKCCLTDTQTDECNN